MSKDKKPEERLEKIRHSLSHIMTMAVLGLYPKAGLGVGPTIENGFYQDYDLSENISEDILPKIEKRMKEIIKQKIEFVEKKISFDDALKFYENDPYKSEMIKDLKAAGEKEVCFYQSGEFENLCKGPHVKNTSEIDFTAFKLTKTAGAYWKGNEKNKMLTRIYGVAFENKAKLKDYIKRIEEAEKRDHRKLGTELDLFIMNEEVGAGLPLFMPKGARLRHEIMNFALNTYLKNGYELVQTPHIASEKLWSHSGHLDFYSDGMYSSFGVEGDDYRLKPMNCPLQVQIYKARNHSYRDLPIRWTEMGTVYRYERSGTLHGLTRVRGFTQDDAHIICTPDQLKNEVKKALDLTMYMLKTFGFEELEMNLSVRDPKDKGHFIGDDKNWQQAEKALKEVLEESGHKDFVYDVGGAVFYGPKIDVKIKDAIGRQWQLSTIQFDFNLPSRFELFYIDEQGKKQEPFMIHRALLGSLERFMGVYIEHTAGAFPVWIAPVQVIVVPVSEKFNDYAEEVKQTLFNQDIRVEIDNNDESLGKKIRNAEKQKLPYILVVGEKEMKDKSVAVRKRSEGDLGPQKIDKFIETIKEDIEEKK